MKVTQEYLDNTKAIEKFLKTFNFEEKSAERIRQYIANPLSVVNDDIKALFAKYDNDVVDYRLPLPASMIKQRKKIQREIYLIYSLIFDCLSEDNQFKFTVDESGNFRPDFSISPMSISDGFFKVGNDKRKVWRYIDSKLPIIVGNFYKKWLANKTFTVNADGSYKEYIDLKNDRFGLAGFFIVMNDYIRSLGSRKTALKDKIQKFNKSDSIIIDLSNKTEEEAIKTLTNEAFKPMLNIIQEIISAKQMDLEKFKLYLSFNVFDWLLASSGENWHSCIDMASHYAFGVGLLGMCGCPDWGMLLYTDGTSKEFGGIKTYHIVTRSWVCYLETNEFQVIGWYPKDIRGSISFTDSEDFKFHLDGPSNRSSKSSWDPIIFPNGSVAWIYADMNRFVVDKGDHTRIRFNLDGTTGIPHLYKADDGKIYNDSDGAMDSVIKSISSRYNSIWDAVSHDYVIGNLITARTKKYRCSCCGEAFANQGDLIWVEDEEEYVCRNCITSHYFECPRCGHYHRYENGCREVRNGEHVWDYELYCEECADELENDGEIFYDQVAGAYFSTDVENYYTDRAGNDICVSTYTITNLLNDGAVFRHTDGHYYNYREEEEGEN